ncbi:MAG TPA: hypothetical protein PK867_21015 [Pirellulales bacterium]|nr:hypothetical protein [Pirellulales bacterium]
MDLAETERKFARAGLWTAHDESSLLCLARQLATAPDDARGDVAVVEANGDEIEFYRTVADGRPRWLGDEAIVDRFGSGWRFKNGPPTVFGGACPDYFSFKRASLSEVVDAAWQY